MISVFYFVEQKDYKKEKKKQEDGASSVNAVEIFVRNKLVLSRNALPPSVLSHQGPPPKSIAYSSPQDLLDKLTRGERDFGGMYA